MVYNVRGQLELARGRDADALAAWRAAERLSGHLAAPHLARRAGAGVAAARPGALGRTGRAERPWRWRAGPRTRGDPRRHGGAAARPGRPARGDHRAHPGPGRLRSCSWRSWLVNAFMLEAIARDALGDPAAAGRALERALDMAGPDLALSAFLLYPAPGLLERHARDSARHAALIAEILTCWGPGGTRGARGGSLGAGPGRDQSPPADRAAESERDPRAALYADQPIHAGDRPRAVLVGAHSPDARTTHLRQARRAPPHRGGRASPRPRPARTIPIPRALRLVDNHDASVDNRAVTRPARRAPAGGYGAIGSRCWPAPGAVTSPGHKSAIPVSVPKRPSRAGGWHDG